MKIKLFNQDEQSLDLVFETNSDDFLEKAKVFAKELKLALSQIGFLTNEPRDLKKSPFF